MTSSFGFGPQGTTPVAVQSDETGVPDVNSYHIASFVANVKKAEVLKYAEACKALALAMLPDVQFVEVTVAHVKSVKFSQMS